MKFIVRPVVDDDLRRANVFAFDRVVMSSELHSPDDLHRVGIAGDAKKSVGMSRPIERIKSE